MNELIIEKLIQKVNTAIEELMNLNLLVRSLPPSVEIMNLLNTRIDAIQASIVQLRGKYRAIIKASNNFSPNIPGFYRRLKK
jgi:hypothetical protein